MAKKIEQSLPAFMQKLEQALTSGSFQKLILSKPCGADKTVQRITLKPVELKGELQLSWVTSHQTQTFTKNIGIGESLELIVDVIATEFKAAHVFSSDGELQLNISKKGKIQVVSHSLKPKSQGEAPSEKSLQHNRDKKRFVDINRPFLQALSVTDQQHKLVPAMSKKWKQINKFIEVFSQALDTSPLAVKNTDNDAKASNENALQVVDFGSGKGYLTFAIHDYLQESNGYSAQVTGVELREELANLCQKTAASLEHSGLNFVCGDVQTHAPTHTDVMIALHACDTATDYAINYGIQANAAIIMCSPCCHKQIRPQMQSPALFKPMLQYGVHLGQEAEMVTDSLRALLLEVNGYKTKIFEFISLEHTNKNKMILAVKRLQPLSQQKHDELLEQIANIKAFYGITDHCLERLLLSAG